MSDPSDDEALFWALHEDDLVRLRCPTGASARPRGTPPGGDRRISHHVCHLGTPTREIVRRRAAFENRRTPTASRRPHFGGATCRRPRKGGPSAFYAMGRRETAGYAGMYTPDAYRAKMMRHQ